MDCIVVGPLALLLAGCDAPVLPERALTALEVLQETPEWRTGGHDDGQSYYSPLAQINRDTVSGLGFAWSYDLDSDRGQEATPILVGSILYISAPWGAAHAIDAETGERVWKFVPEVDGDISRKVCCGIVNRGLSYADGLIFVASIDGRLFALDALTGAVRWRVNTIIDAERGYSVTGSTYVAGDLVLIGNSGAELDARGYVSAYNISDGSLAWRFFTVPASAEGPFEHPEMATAASTWDKNSAWEVGLGGTVWDGMAYDPDLDLLYIGVGNSTPYPRSIRSPSGGDNLYVASILALDRKSGRLVWHYQTTPGDQWDYTATQKMILADIELGGRKRSVILQAPKNGFFYVIDRTSGELLSAEPYVPVNWASHVDPSTGRPLETAQSDYSTAPKLIFPSPQGGHNWNPMAYNPKSGLVYIPVVESGAVYWMSEKPFDYKKGALNIGLEYAWIVRSDDGFIPFGTASTHDLPSIEVLAKGQPDPTMRAYLRAWDPVSQSTAWDVETTDRWAGQMNAMGNGGGILTTAGGLVFQGRSTGMFYGFDAGTGEQLAALDTGVSIMAAPMTYEIAGEQYIAVAGGYGGANGRSYPPGTAAYRYGNKGKIIVLKLGGPEVPLPAAIERDTRFARPDTPRPTSADLLDLGNALLTRHCVICHKTTAAAGSVPDLRRMSGQTRAKFREIVLGGLRADQGMGSFEGVITEAEADAIAQAILAQTWDAYDAQQDDHKRSHNPEDNR